MTQPQAHILVDLDEVVAQWGKGYDASFGRLYPDLPFTPHHQRTSFNLNAGHTAEGIAAVQRVMDLPGFYADLEPVDGAAEALNAMLDDGFDVSICTAPWISNPTCASDKLAWVEKHLGLGWAARTVITRDKGRVRGQVLIDDKPHAGASSVYTPEWTQVYFTQPYNVDLPGPRLDRWEDWRAVLDDVLHLTPSL